MLYREVPKNGDKLSILGFGAMRLPTRVAQINEKLAEKQILYSIDKGVNYLDTAVPYHNGKSEPFLGKVLSKNGYRDKVKIATKLPHWSTNSVAEMEKALSEQLDKLRTDRIDYYLIHNLNGITWEIAKNNGVLDFLDRSLASGKILNAGFSYHGLADDFTQVVDDYDWTFCQIQYNFLDTKNQAGKKGLKYAASKDLAVIIMEPLRGGNLAQSPPPAVQKVWAKSDKKRTPVDWALRWIWNHPEVTTILSGMNDEKQIDENVDIANSSEPSSMPDSEVKLVREAANTFRSVMKVGCTSCQYCMPCPSGVNIPGCFEYYNSRHAFKDKSAKMFYLGMLGGIFTGKPAFASECTKCGQCEEECPQSLPIQDLLEDVEKDMEGIFTKPLLWIIKKVMSRKKRKV
ncbi:MAG: aldo/keto reductase [Desulfobacterales bacterium]|nr:aldo/keto reductase [Desulfobacterales bacterium]MCP4159754.1 aldo/keto reductase [Deltaproteobacteria bacterium]